MSMNITIRAVGTVITPSGKKMRFVKHFNVSQTSTENSRAIMAAEDKYAEYVKNYGDYGLKKWIIRMKHFGFSIEWDMF